MKRLTKAAAISLMLGSAAFATPDPTPSPKPPFHLMLGEGEKCAQQDNCAQTATAACNAIGYKNGQAGKSETLRVYRGESNGGPYLVKNLVEATCTDT